MKNSRLVIVCVFLFSCISIKSMEMQIREEITEVLINRKIIFRPSIGLVLAKKSRSAQLAEKASNITDKVKNTKVGKWRYVAETLNKVSDGIDAVSDMGQDAEDYFTDSVRREQQQTYLYTCSIPIPWSQTEIVCGANPHYFKSDALDFVQYSPTFLWGSFFLGGGFSARPLYRESKETSLVALSSILITYGLYEMLKDPIPNSPYAEASWKERNPNYNKPWRVALRFCSLIGGPLLLLYLLYKNPKPTLKNTVTLGLLGYGSYRLILKYKHLVSFSKRERYGKTTRD